MYRLSVLDIIVDGRACSQDEMVALAKLSRGRPESDILNSGIGWHEARVPTIAQAVPRGGWTSSPPHV